MRFLQPLPVFNDISQRVSRALGLGGRLALTAGAEIVPTYPVPLPPSIIAEGRGVGAWDSTGRLTGVGNAGGIILGNLKNSGKVFVVTRVYGRSTTTGGDMSIRLRDGYNGGAGYAVAGSVAIDRAGQFKRRGVSGEAWLGESATQAMTGAAVGSGYIGYWGGLATPEYSVSGTLDDPVCLLWPDEQLGLWYSTFNCLLYGGFRWQEFPLPASS